MSDAGLSLYFQAQMESVSVSKRALFIDRWEMIKEQLANVAKVEMVDVVRG